MTTALECVRYGFGIAGEEVAEMVDSLERDKAALSGEIDYQRCTIDALVKDTDALNERIKQLESELAAKQAKIDALMLQYCPDEMSQEQISNWEIDQIISYGCHCDLEPDKLPDGCVIDEGRNDDCVHARSGGIKENCQYWLPIKIQGSAK